jgi:demethylmenaquinone methyltransferase/2-methoxy-6-polyprenyl-1,4-benzoquinol methylase
MFDRIAPVYDLMNTIMTVGIDGRWRRAALAGARLGPGMRGLDVACGTGKLTRALAQAVGPGGEALGIDVSAKMLARAKQAGGGARYRVADALALPFGADRFDAALTAFGLRNVPDYAAALGEMARVTRPGGRVVVLEIAIPRTAAGRLVFETWFRRVIPRLGRLAGVPDAYRYLPRSLDTYPSPPEVAALMRQAGLLEVRWRRLTTGLATLHVGVAPGGAP